MTRTGDGVEIEQGQSLYVCGGTMVNRPLLVSYLVPVASRWITMSNGVETFKVPAEALFSSSMAAGKARVKYLQREIDNDKGHIGYLDTISQYVLEKSYLDKIVDWHEELGL